MTEIGPLPSARVNETFPIRNDGEARRARTSKCEVVREATRQRLKQKSTPTALDSLSGLSGIMEGPTDLSTKKRYLANFGKGRRAQ